MNGGQHAETYGMNTDMFDALNFRASILNTLDNVIDFIIIGNTTDRYNKQIIFKKSTMTYSSDRKQFRSFKDSVRPTSDVVGASLSSAACFEG